MRHFEWRKGLFAVPLRLVLLFPLIALLPMPAAAVPLDITGWWWNPQEPGRGFSIERQNNTLFFASYVYDAVGVSPVWYLSTGQMVTDTRYEGTLHVYANGQSLNGPYRQPSPQPFGTMSIDFIDGGTASMTWPGGTTKISRFPLAPNGLTSARNSFQPETGWYYAPDESGSGYFLEIQGSTLFMAAFMYTTAGSPVWYISSGNLVTERVFEGDLDQFGDGQPLAGGTYRPPSAKTTVGRINITFSSTTDATLTVLGTGRRIPLQRFIFEVLPPAPGAANDQSVAGIDSDRDGVRDDLQIAIAQLAPKSTILRDSLREIASALQAFVRAPYSSQGATTSTRIEIAQACLRFLLPQVDLAITARLTVDTFNTTGRSRYFFDYLDYASLAPQAPNPSAINLTECSFIQGRARLNDFGYWSIVGGNDPRVAQPGQTLDVLRQDRLTAAAAPQLADGVRTGRALDRIPSGRVATRPPRNVCQQGVTVFHVNGINTTAPEAHSNMLTLEDVVRPTVGSDWQFDHMLNETSGQVVYDLWVAFQQSAPGATFTQFLEAFFTLKALASSDLRTAFASAMAAVVIKSTNNLISSRTNAFVQRVKNEVALGRIVILAPHSQGNFYVNAVYRHASLSMAEKAAVGIVSVANPDQSVAVDGPGLTRDDDYLMAATRLLVGSEPATIMSANLVPPPTGFSLNHNYIQSYLRQGGASEQIVVRFPLVRSRLQPQPSNQSARVIEQESGGQGTIQREFGLGSTPGIFRVKYEMYTVPDRLDVIYRGTTVASTGGLVSGSNTLSFNYVPVANDYTVTILVTAPHSGTAWDYAAYCPSSS